MKVKAKYNLCIQTLPDFENPFNISNWTPIWGCSVNRSDSLLKKLSSQVQFPQLLNCKKCRIYSCNSTVFKFCITVFIDLSRDNKPVVLSSRDSSLHLWWQQKEKSNANKILEAKLSRLKNLLLWIASQSKLSRTCEGPLWSCKIHNKMHWIYLASRDRRIVDWWGTETPEGDEMGVRAHPW